MHFKFQLILLSPWAKDLCENEQTEQRKRVDWPKSNALRLGSNLELICLHDRPTNRLRADTI